MVERDAGRRRARPSERQRQARRGGRAGHNPGGGRAARRAALAGGALNLSGPVYGLLSAIWWGAGDFGGGLVSRFSSVFSALIAGESIGLLGSVAVAVAVGEPLPSTTSFAWAFAAGTCGIAGLGAFYYALSRGTMGVVAPLTAVIGAALPVVIGLIEGEHLEPVRGVGIVVALAAVVLISMPGNASTTDERRLRRIDLSQLPLIMAGGVGFGLFFVFLSRAADAGSTWWPLVVVRMAGVAFIVGAVVVALARTKAPRLATRADIVLGLPKVRARALPMPLLAGMFLLTGVGDLGGNAFFVLAARADVLSVAVVLSSLYPVVTTLLAAVFLHERLRPVQIVGVLLASISVPLLR